MILYCESLGRICSRKLFLLATVTFCYHSFLFIERIMFFLGPELMWSEQNKINCVLSVRHPTSLSLSCSSGVLQGCGIVISGMRIGRAGQAKFSTSNFFSIALGNHTIVELKRISRDVLSRPSAFKQVNFKAFMINRHSGAPNNLTKKNIQWGWEEI